MSQHLDTVATSTLNQKQCDINLQGERGRDNFSLRKKVTTSVRGRDSSSEEKRSRQQFHRKEVATTSGCRDINYKDLRS